MSFLFFLNKRKVIISLISLFCLTAQLTAQSNFQYWNTEEGLSNDWVSQVIQDKDGYIWIATQYGINRFDGYEFRTYQYEPNNPNTLSANWVRKLVQDDSGIFWLSSYLGGLNAFDPKTGKVTRYLIRKDSTQKLNVRAILCDKKESVWVGNDQGLFVKHTNQANFEIVLNLSVLGIEKDENQDLILLSEEGIYQYNKNTNELSLLHKTTDQNIRQIYLDNTNELWIIGMKGFSKLIKEKNQWIKEDIKVNNFAQVGYFAQSPIFKDSKNRIWIGGEKGISIIDTKDEKAKTYPYEGFFPKGKAIGKALSFFEDKHQNIWIGTSKGLILQSPFAQRFALKEPIPHLNEFTNIRQVLQVDRNLWISNPDGLFRIALDNPKLLPQRIISHPIHSLLKSSDGYLYAGEKGFYKIDLKDFSLTYFPANKKEGGLKGETIWSIIEDDSGKIWLGAINMLNRFDPKTKEFEYFSKENIPELEDAPSQALLIDSKGRLWASSLFSGLYMLEKPNEQKTSQEFHFIQFNYDETDIKSLSNKMVIALAEGTDGAIWAATDSGLNRIDPNTFVIKRFLKKDGLLDEKIMGLLVDDDGFIWGSTIGHGIFRLNPETEAFTFFNRKDGLSSNNFLLNSYCKNQDGILFFGSDNELQAIDPKRIDQIEKPKIQFEITGLQVTGTTSNTANQDVLLENRNSVTLPYNYQSLLVQFSTLNFYQAQKTEYLYLLEGLHSHWQSNGRRRTIRFTGLSVGNYVLKIKAKNPDLIFEQAEQILNIIILPPWWKTKKAYFFYLLMILSLLFLIYRFQLKRELELAEAQRLQEIDTLKTRFFTNITHEFRTPLTIILGMADKIKKTSKKEIANKAGMIQRNGQQLLALINQILDISKLESGKMPVQMEHGNLLPYLNYISESFHSLATTKNIRLHFLPEIQKLWMDYDAEKIKQITTNLLSNAIKHTNQNGDIYLQVHSKNNWAELVFRDTGKGIEAAHLPHIFERFYQTENKIGGTGIGLSLTKELVELLNGNIDVESEIGRGTTFRVHLPIIKNVNTPLSTLSEIAVPQRIEYREISFAHLNSIHSEDIPLILLIEDNEDVTHYLVDCLKVSYRIEISGDGEAGIQKALDIIPDLIISDVMMPRKDGYEVCQALKKNKKTSHIPIVLLTAKAGLPSKLKGLEYGADAYLYKPFNEKELDIRIRKLLESRQQLQNRFQDKDFWETKKLQTVHIEDAFVVNVRNIVEANLNDTSFGIPQLCRALGISRVHLHRKLKALTNQSTSHFIRRIRLQKAKILLENSDLNISEIAYDVGFSDPSYFSRLYSETFGEAPNEMRK